MEIREIVTKHGRTPDKLIEVMLELQGCSDQNYLTSSDIKVVSDEMGILESRVYNVACFYSLLSTEPRGKHIIQLCNDVPCYINGSYNLLSDLESKLGIKVGETTSDNLFTLEFTSCLGCCDTAPVMQIGEKVYGNLTGKKIDKVLEELRRDEK